MLKSKRCQFRRFKDSDFENMRLLESNPEVVRFTSLRVPISSEQIMLRLTQTISAQPQREPLGIWAIETHEKEFVGWIMLLQRELPHTELGYMLVPKFWNQGYASEVTQTLTQYAFEQLQIHAISACTDFNNYASIRVLEKLGFKLIETTQKTDAITNEICKYNTYLLRKNE